MKKIEGQNNLQQIKIKEMETKLAENETDNLQLI